MTDLVTRVELFKSGASYYEFSRAISSDEDSFELRRCYDGSYLIANYDLELYSFKKVYTSRKDKSEAEE